jgi:transcriptional regulator with XRE-family HTH domain
MTVVTNDEFARLTGCTYTMASKLRNGARKPSGSLLTRIILVFQLDAQEATEAYAGGAVMFGDYLTRTVFSPTPNEAMEDAG